MRGGPARRRLRCAGLTALLAAPLLGAAQPLPQPVDPALRTELIAALADEGFDDRFEAEVWLTDMSARLRAKVPDARQRLELLHHVHREAHRVDLPPELVLAVIEVESAFDRFAISEAGARGLMQVMPFWLKETGHPEANLFDVATNLRFGCTILRHYLDAEAGDFKQALARYNGSRGSDRYPVKVFNALSARWRP